MCKNLRRVFIYLFIYLRNRSWSLFFFFLILFIWLHRVLVVARGIFAAACRLSRGAGSRVRRLSSCGTRAPQLWCAGLVAPRHVGILVPQPGIEPVSPALEGGFLTTGPPGRSPNESFYKSLHPCLGLDTRFSPALHPRQRVQYQPTAEVKDQGRRAGRGLWNILQ